MSQTSIIEFHNQLRVQSFRGPKGWNDLTYDQLLFWSSVLRKKMTKDETLLMACLKFYHIPKTVYLNLPKVYDLNLCWQMEWLLQNKLTTNVIGKFNIFFTTYYGPANRLANITIGEFRKTELFYDMFLRTGLSKYLHFLGALLFRPKGNSALDDVRKISIESDIMKRAKWFNKF